MPQDNIIRCFVAAVPDANCLAFLSMQLEILKKARIHTQIRWLNTENIHLTLKFLGDTSERLLPSLGSALQTVAQETTALTLQIQNARYFPRASQARVVACPIDKEDKLDDLARRIDLACAAFGFATEQRSFRGHISIGRVKQRRVTPLPLLESAGFTWTMDSICIMQSELRPEGAQYSVLASFPFSQA